MFFDGSKQEIWNFQKHFMEQRNKGIPYVVAPLYQVVNGKLVGP